MEKGGGKSGRAELRKSPMMVHLMDALEKGRDIEHYGRLVFVMVARHFLSEAELVGSLARQPGMGETEALALVRQVREKDYNPPKRERILEWQKKQDFPICPNPEDPKACNVYRELEFPGGIYDNIVGFWGKQAESEEE